MNRSDFQKTFAAEYTNESRVWVFPLTRNLSEESWHHIEASLKNFFSTWDSHGDRVNGRVGLFDKRVLVVASDLAAKEMGGCSMDSMRHAVNQALSLLQVVNSNGNSNSKLGVLSALDVLVKLDGVDKRGTRIGTTEWTGPGTAEWTGLSRMQIAGAMERGSLHAHSHVLSRDLTTLGELREKLVLPLEETWLKSFLATPVNS